MHLRPVMLLVSCDSDLAIGLEVHYVAHQLLNVALLLLLLVNLNQQLRLLYLLHCDVCHEAVHRQAHEEVNLVGVSYPLR